VNNHVHSAELTPTNIAATNEEPAKPATAAPSAHSAPQTAVDSFECQGDGLGRLKALPSRDRPNGSCDSVVPPRPRSDRNDLVVLATSTAAIATAHAEFSQISRVTGASQVASSDVLRIGGCTLRLRLSERTRQSAHTVVAQATNTSKTRSAAERNNSGQENVLWGGNRQPRLATAPATSNPAAGAAHLGNVLGAEVSSATNRVIRTAPPWALWQPLRDAVTASARNSKERTRPCTFDTKARRIVPDALGYPFLSFNASRESSTDNFRMMPLFSSILPCHVR